MITVALKGCHHPEARKGDTLVRLRSTDHGEQGKNNPAIVMWSIGNEVGEADGSDKFVVNRSSVSHTTMIGCNSQVTMGADKFRFGDGIRGHEKWQQSLMAVGFNYSEATESLRAKHPNWLIYGSGTSSRRGHGVHNTNTLKENVGSNQEDRHYEQSDHAMTGLVGVGQQPPLDL